jgi:hypothetical protein
MDGWNAAVLGARLCTAHWMPECKVCTSWPLVVDQYHNRSYKEGKRCIRNRAEQIYCCLVADTDSERLCGALYPVSRDFYKHVHVLGCKYLRGKKRKCKANVETTPQGPEVEEKAVLRKRLEVSDRVLERILAERGEAERGDEESEECKSSIGRFIREECARLGHAAECRPSAAVVLQRYKWERMKADMVKRDPPDRLGETLDLRRQRYFAIVDELMRDEDAPLEEKDQDAVAARIEYLWESRSRKGVGRGRLAPKQAVACTLMNWVQQTYARSPLAEGKRRAEKGSERYKDKEEEEEMGVEERTTTRKRRRKEEEEEETTVEEEETTPRQAGGMSSKIKEEDTESEDEGATQPYQPQRDTNWEPIGPAPLTGRSLLLAQRRRIMETLDSILLPHSGE